MSWKDCDCGMARIRAEIERCSTCEIAAHKDEQITTLTRERDEARAEVERLRAALAKAREGHEREYRNLEPTKRRQMMFFTLYREDPDTGEEIAIELDVLVKHFHPGSIPGPRAITDDPGELELGEIFRADTGERFEPTREELDRIKEYVWERLCRRSRSMYWD